MQLLLDPAWLQRNCRPSMVIITKCRSVMKVTKMYRGIMKITRKYRARTARSK